MAALCARLAAAASLVRGGAFLADVGTDHALLPLALLRAGRIRGAVASDIAEGPLARARGNIEAGGFSDRVTTVLADGLSGLDAFCPTDVALCGMGGETIRNIVCAAPWLRSPALRLICQPQSFIPMLRGFLLGAGFALVDEVLCVDRGKYYVCLAAEYDGCAREYSPEELLLGRVNIARGGELLRGYAAHLADVLTKARAGRLRAGLDISREDELLMRLKQYTK